MINGDGIWFGVGTSYLMKSNNIIICSQCWRQRKFSKEEMTNLYGHAILTEASQLNPVAP
jgi:hypothetical protein